MWFSIQNQQVKIRIFAKPNAKKTAFLGFSEKGLLISIHAKPHKGAANLALVEFLAQLLQLPKTQIILLKGENSRVKQVLVPLTTNVQKFINQKIEE